MQHASDNWWVSGIVVLLALIIIFKVLSAQRGRVPYIRRIAGLNAIDEAVGRATEMGRPVMMVPGISGLDVVTLQALSIFGYIARAVARFGNKSIIPTIDPIVTGVAEETLHDAYADAGTAGALRLERRALPDGPAVRLRLGRGGHPHPRARGRLVPVRGLLRRVA